MYIIRSKEQKQNNNSKINVQKYIKPLATIIIIKL